MLPEDTSGGLGNDNDYIYRKSPGVLYTSDFKDGEGKYLSVVDTSKGDENYVVRESSKLQIRAAYIKEKDQIVELRIEKYQVKSTGLELESTIRIDTKNTDTLINFLDFLKTSDIPAISNGKLTFDKNLALDPNLEQKLKTLVGDSVGKKQLIKLFESGYLTSDLDIPQLIQKGLSKQKIEEKMAAIDLFEELINKPDVKEVGEIQGFLKKQAWIFGPEYKGLDYRDAGFSGDPDGRLIRIDGLTDILEVKLPKAELLREDGRHRQFIAPELAEALGQLTGYLEYYYSEYTHERSDATGEEITQDRYGKYYKPKGILLIGRRGKELTAGTLATISAEPKNLRRLLSYFHWVEVLTYDDLIDRARNGIRNLSS